MKKELIILVGAPGAGKSTWAKEQAEKRGAHANTAVLCRDDLRQMLWQGNYKFSRENEAIVMKALLDTLLDLLNNKTTTKIIIADTNLNASVRNKYYEAARTVNLANGYEITVSEMPFQVPWVELEKRNLARGAKAVPIDTLRSMYKNMEKYLGRHKPYQPDTSLPKAVIFDIDGTLANNDHRSPYALWQLDKDSPREMVVDLLNKYKADNYKIICLSGRHSGTKEEPTKYYDMTAEWLKKHNIEVDELLLRATGDSRKDDIIKEELFWNHVAPKYNVRLAIDDRNRVVELWRRIDLECWQVNHGDF